MNAALGNAAVLLGLLGALAGAATTAAGVVKGRDRWVRAGRSYVWVVLAGALLATAALQHALITHDYTLQYVGNNDGNATPLLYRITAMWSALEGSMLLWALVLAGYLVAMTRHFRARATDPLVAWATAIAFGVATFFFGVLLLVSNPFGTYAAGQAPTDGPGPDPLLQNHVLVAFHPPILYLGLVGFTVPFAFAAASLITGRVGEGWLLETRRWTLFAWAFLTAGIVLGAWWSYEVLGWGGFWAWDPVENSAFIPWLTATAFLHSVMVQERRGMLRVWNLSLVLATFGLTILGTFLTRSGLLASVHSFSVSSIGPVLLGFFGVVVAASVGLIAWRGDLLRASGTIDAAASREGAFLANNLLFSLFAVVVLLGTVFPLVASTWGQSVTVGAPYFNELSLPIAVCLLFLMAVAPVLPWRKASGELLRSRLQWPVAAAALTLGVCVTAGVRGLAPLGAFGLGAFAAGSAGRQLVLAVRRSGASGLVGRVNGGMVVHLGVVVLACAFAASRSYTTQTTLSLRPGQTAAFGGHTYTFVGMRSTRSATKSTLAAEVRVDGGQTYAPAISTYPFAAESVGTPSVRTSLSSDQYLTITNPPSTDGGPVTIGISDEPLVEWVWIGGGVMVLGTVLSAFPGRRRRRPTDPVSAPVASPAAPDPVPVAVGGA